MNNQTFYNETSRNLDGVFPFPAGDDENLYQSLFETIPLPAFIVDFETLDIIVVNKSAVENYGYSPREFTAMSIKEIYPPNLNFEFKITNGDEICSGLETHQRKDGTIFEVKLNSHSFISKNRRVKLVLIREIVGQFEAVENPDNASELQRIKAEAAVISKIIQGVSTTSNLEELLDLIHRSIGEILDAENFFVALYDKNSELLTMQFFVDKHDSAPPPIKLGKGFTAYTFRSERPMLMTPAVMKRLMENGEVGLVGTLPAIWMGVPLRTPNGVIGVAVVQHYENENAYHRNDLKLLTSVGDQIALAIERKQAEDQLKLFNNRLQQSNRELQEFAYVASHDLQEPLRKVQAFSDRLAKKYGEKLESEGLDYLERMRNAASRMQILIQDLLTFSRVSTKAQPFVPVNLDTITREVLSDLEVKIEETGASVEIKNLPMIDADALQMRQLIQNMLSNALKFRRADVAPTIKVSAKHLTDRKSRNQTCRIYIEDNGIGFDEKYTGKIFTVFQRLHGRGEYEGSGVGLAVCRKIVERHNGTIEAKSKPGEGTTFIITLPINQINTEAE